MRTTTVSRTVKGGRDDGGGNPEYWAKRPHSKLGSHGIGKYVKSRTASTERRQGKSEVDAQLKMDGMNLSYVLIDELTGG